MSQALKAGSGRSAAVRCRPREEGVKRLRRAGGGSIFGIRYASGKGDRITSFGPVKVRLFSFVETARG